MKNLILIEYKSTFKKTRNFRIFFKELKKEDCKTSVFIKNKVLSKGLLERQKRQNSALKVSKSFLFKVIEIQPYAYKKIDSYNA